MMDDRHHGGAVLVGLRFVPPEQPVTVFEAWAGSRWPASLERDRPELILVDGRAAMELGVRRANATT